MEQQYESLGQLIYRDSTARDYFDHLPEEIRDQMEQQADRVRSLSALRRYAERFSQKH